MPLADRQPPRHRIQPLASLPLAALSFATLLAGCDPSGDAGQGTPPEPPGGLTERAGPAPDGAVTPNLASDAEGRVLLSWIERGADSSAAFRFASWDGGAWSSPRTIAAGRPFFVNWADFPSMVRLGGERLAAHWLEREGNGTYHYGIRIARSDDGGEHWSTAATPHGDGLPAEHGFVSLWGTPDGTIGATWLDGRKTAMADSAREMTIRAGTLRGSGSDSGTDSGASVRWVVEEALLDARACDCCQTATATTRRGRVVVYRDRSPEEIRDIALVREEDGRWLPPVRVHDDRWHMPACPVNGPSVAASGDAVAVAWFTAAGDTARVRLAWSRDGGRTFGAPVRIDDGDPLGRVQVVLDDRGDALVAWMERVPGGAELRARRVDAEGRTSTGVTWVRTGAARANGFPRIARAGDRWLVAWTATAADSGGAGIRIGEVPVR